MGNVDCCPAERPRSNGLRLMMPLSEEIIDRITQRLSCSIASPEHIRAISILAVKEHDALRRLLFPADGNLSTTPNRALLSSDLYQYVLLLFALSCYSIPHLLRSDIINLHSLAPDSVHHVVADKYSTQYGYLNDKITLEEHVTPSQATTLSGTQSEPQKALADSEWVGVSSITKEMLAGAVARELQWPFHSHNAKTACLQTLVEAARTQMCAEEALAHAYAPALDVAAVLADVSTQEATSVESLVVSVNAPATRSGEDDALARAEREEDKKSENVFVFPKIPFRTLSDSPSPSPPAALLKSLSRPTVRKNDSTVKLTDINLTLTNSDNDDVRDVDMRVDAAATRVIQSDLALLSLGEDDAAMLPTPTGATEARDDAAVGGDAAGALGTNANGNSSLSDLGAENKVNSQGDAEAQTSSQNPDPSPSRKPTKARPAPLRTEPPLALGSAGIVVTAGNGVGVYEDAGVLLFGLDGGLGANSGADVEDIGFGPMSPLAALNHDHSSDEDDDSHVPRSATHPGDSSRTRKSSTSTSSRSSRQQRPHRDSRQESPSRSQSPRWRASRNSHTTDAQSIDLSRNSSHRPSSRSSSPASRASASLDSGDSHSTSKSSHVTRPRTRSQSAHRAASPPPRARSPSAKGLSRARWFDAVAAGVLSLCKLATALSIGRAFPTAQPGQQGTDAAAGSARDGAAVARAAAHAYAAEVFGQSLTHATHALTQGPLSAKTFTAMMAYFLPAYSALSPLLSQSSPLTKTMEKSPAALPLLVPPSGVICLDRLRLLPLLLGGGVAQPLLGVSSRLLHTQVMKTLRRVVLAVEQTLCTHANSCAMHAKPSSSSASSNSLPNAPTPTSVKPAQTHFDRLPAGTNICVSELDAHVRRAVTSVCRVQVELATMEQEAPVYQELDTASQLVCVAPAHHQRPITLTIDCSVTPASVFAPRDATGSGAALSPPKLSPTPSGSNSANPRALPVLLLPAHLRWADWQQVPTSLSQWRLTTSQNIASSISMARKYSISSPTVEPLSPTTPMAFTFNTPTAHPQARRILFLIEQAPLHATIVLLAPNALAFVATQITKVNAKLQQRQRARSGDASAGNLSSPSLGFSTSYPADASPLHLPAGSSPSASSIEQLSIPTHIDAWVVSWLITYIAANTSTDALSPIPSNSSRSSRAMPLTPQHVPAQLLGQTVNNSSYLRALSAGDCFSQADIDEGRVWLLPHDVCLCGAVEADDANGLHCGSACTCARDRMLLDAAEGIVRLIPGTFHASTMSGNRKSGAAASMAISENDSDGENDMYARAHAGKTRWGSRRSIVLRDSWVYSVQCSDGRRSEGHRNELNIVCEWE